MTPTQPNALEAPHQLQLDSRARRHMTGGIEVESFEESTIVLTTTRGTLIVRGEGLHLQLLRLDGGEVLVDGTVDALTYEDSQPAGSFLARLYGCKAAVLKERSPSCGSGNIYDGTFSGCLTPGDGVTAALLKENGITVYGESEIEMLLSQAEPEEPQQSLF